VGEQSDNNVMTDGRVFARPNYFPALLAAASLMGDVKEGFAERQGLDFYANYLMPKT
jgi:hypothetical protein